MLVLINLLSSYQT